MPASGSWPGAGDGLAQENLRLFPELPVPGIAEVPKKRGFRGCPPARRVPTTASSPPGPICLAPAGYAAVTRVLYPTGAGLDPGGSASPAASLAARCAAPLSALPGRWDSTGESPSALIGISGSWGLCAAPELNQTRPRYPGTSWWGQEVDALPGWPCSLWGRPIPLPCSSSCSPARSQPRGGRGCSSQSPAVGDTLQRVFWACRDRFRWR